MNNDVLKSLGYLKKSLGMSNRAILNALKRDPNDRVSDKVQDLINDLIDAIKEIEVQFNSVPVPPVPSSVGSSVASSVGSVGASISPMVQVVAQNTSADNGLGIDFLEP